MQADLDAFAAYCFQREWPFEVNDDTTLAIRRKVSHGELLCTARVQPNYFIFRSRYPFVAPESKRVSVAEFAARVNFQSSFAAVYLNASDGEIGVTTAIPVGEGYLCSAVIDPVVRLNLAMAEQWLSSVAAMCLPDVAPSAP